MGVVTPTSFLCTLLFGLWNWTGFNGLASFAVVDVAWRNFNVALIRQSEPLSKLEPTQSKKYNIKLCVQNKKIHFLRRQ